MQKVGDAVDARTRAIFVNSPGNPTGWTLSSDEQRKDIFEYLNRGEQSGKLGWGIGLPFVQEVAKRHGGTVVLDSSEQ